MGDKFSPGDQVQLQSGGPYMTVDKTVNFIVHCIWFVDNETKRDFFSEPLLRHRSKDSGVYISRRPPLNLDTY